MTTIFRDSASGAPTEIVEPTAAEPYTGFLAAGGALGGVRWMLEYDARGFMTRSVASPGARSCSTGG